MIGIVILNYNTWAETKACIESIRKYNTSSCRIYVVDNCSTDNSVEMLRELYSNEKGVVLICNSMNSGYSAGNNLGIKQAEKDGCDYLFIVNSDVELLNDAFTIMLQTLEQNPTYTMVGPSVMDNDNHESQLPRGLLTLRKFLWGRKPFCCLPFFSKLADRVVKSGNNPIVFTGSVSGCCFGVRTSDFHRIDYFDEKLFLYYEEDVLAYKLKEAGGKAVFEKNARVWHKASISTKKEGSAFVQFHRWTSVFYLLKAYSGINKFQQIGIALWNIISWDIMSIVSVQHKEMRRKFRQKNIQILTEKL